LKRRGFTLLELTIAVVLLSLVFSGAFLLHSSTAGAFRSATDEVELTERVSRCAASLSRTLRGAARATLWSPGGSAPGDVTNSVYFTRAIGYDPVLEEIIWDLEERFALVPEPGEPADGVDNDDDGLVDELRLVWTRDEGGPEEVNVVVCAGVLPSGAGEIAGNMLDDDGDGVVDEPGFAVIWGERSVDLQLTVAGRTSTGDLAVRSVTQTVTFRN
jgi:prepilin-type N-terminal cleavage/methylation domain-containing protein